MSKEVRQFFEELKKGEVTTPLQAFTEGIQTVAPGLSLAKMFKDIGDELKHMGAQGSHELAAALFTGNAFVMYPHAGQERSAEHGLSIEAVKQTEIEPMER